MLPIRAGARRAELASLAQAQPELDLVQGQMELDLVQGRSELASLASAMAEPGLAVVMPAGARPGQTALASAQAGQAASLQPAVLPLVLQRPAVMPLGLPVVTAQH
jgi:hypothetical protein